MPVYQYACPDCAEQFDARRPVDERHAAGCPACGATAARQFDPRAVMIQTPAHLQFTRSFYQPQGTVEHTSDYLEGQVLDQHLERCYAAQERAAKIPTFAQFFQKRNPDLDLNQRLTTQETHAVKQALGATHAG